MRIGDSSINTYSTLRLSLCQCRMGGPDTRALRTHDGIRNRYQLSWAAAAVLRFKS
jgi:hypothetical protein